MRLDTQSIEIPQSVTEGAAVNVAELDDLTVQVSGVFVASMDVEGSQDGVTWAPLSTGITAPGFTVVPGAVRKMRISVTAFTSGAPVGLIGGRNTRTY